MGSFRGLDVDFNTTGEGISDIKNSNGHSDMFITKYNSDGSYSRTRTIGGIDFDQMYGIDIDSMGNIYITGSFQNIVNFDSIGGTDNYTSNGSDDIFISKYTILYQIDNLDNSLDAWDSLGKRITTSSENGLNGVNDVYLRDTSGSIISKIEVDMTADRDWVGVSGSIDTVNGKSVVSGLTSAPGTASTHTLYIPIPPLVVSSSVRICPEANTLNEVTEICNGGVEFMENETKSIGTDSVTVTKVNVDGQWYWLADGVSGTGGMSLFDSSEFVLRDTLTRLQVGVLSNHTIEFGSVNGLETSGDTIEITFDPENQAWDLSSILLTDIEMDADGTPLTLGATPGVDVWGVSINTTTDTITFTAPTSGTSYIEAGTPLVVRIGDNTASGTNQITNPSVVAEYEIYIQNTYQAGGGGVETGEITIPIIDDDTVNVHGYLDTFLHFDIDTVTTDTDCASGVDCQSYGGAGDVVDYVVSLGEMILNTIRKSGDTTLHADGGEGVVNSIWFDIETNADSGVAVTVKSLYGGLQGPGSFLIPSSDEPTADPTSGRNYGLNSVYKSTGLTAESKYDGTQGSSIGSVSQTAQTLFSSSGPVVSGRSQFEVLAYPDVTTPTGTYTDQLTFIATAGF